MNAPANTVAKAVIQTLTDEQLKASDFILVLDHSGSMGEASTRRMDMNKWTELREDTTAIAREAGKHDDDGLTVIAFSSAAKAYDGVTADKVAQLFTEVSPRGSTNLIDGLALAIDKARVSAKNAIILVFTDGVPDDAAGAYALINAAGKELGRPKLGFTFVQVGNDPGAAAFLQKLNDNLTVDVVAVASAADAEGLSLGQLAWMAQNS